jgi:predicted transcriptional regulator YdeE
MEPETVNKPGFRFIGIEVRTNNRDEMTPNGKIGGQWQKFYAENILSKIPGKQGNAVLALYTDYESDQNGEYSFLIGSEVDSLANIPSGLVGKEIAASKYAIFSSSRGPIPAIIFDVWKRIWAYKGTRAYKSDFEVYGKDSVDPKNAQVDVYLSVK